jgi:protein-L-isoaspartate O-methyltransferase
MLDNPDTVAARLRLTDVLAADGLLPEPRWRDAVAAVPRHLFLHEFYTTTSWTPLVDARHPEWLPLVYADTDLVVRPGVNVVHAPATSTCVRLAHAVDPADAGDVGVIGDGCGYLTALFAHVVGPARVTVFNSYPAMIERVRSALTIAGYPATVKRVFAPRESLEADRKSLSRLVSIRGVDRIPITWVDAVTVGGTLVVPVGGRGPEGPIVRLQRAEDGSAIGNFLPGRVPAVPPGPGRGAEAHRFGLTVTPIGTHMLWLDSPADEIVTW